MEKFTELFPMGEYGVYVWPSFAFAALVIVIMVTSSLRSLRRAEKTLGQLQQAPSDISKQ